jgi:hypothetical protein
MAVKLAGERIRRSPARCCRSVPTRPPRPRSPRRRLKEFDADRNRPRRRVGQLLDGVRRGVSRLIDAYQDGLIGKDEFEPRLAKARGRQ